MSGACHL